MQIGLCTQGHIPNLKIANHYRCITLFRTPENSDALHCDFEASITFPKLEALKEHFPAGFTPDDLNTNQEQLLNCGWCPKALMDLNAIIVAGQVMATFEAGAGSPARSLRLDMAAVIANEHKLSSRLKSVFRTQSTRAKKAWDLMIFTAHIP